MGLFDDSEETRKIGGPLGYEFPEEPPHRTPEMFAEWREGEVYGNPG